MSFTRAYRRYRRDGLLSVGRSALSMLTSHPARIHPITWKCKHGLRVLHNSLSWDAIADPFKVVRVDPDAIDRYTTEFGKWESVGLIDGGDWDREAEPLETFVKYRACVDRFVRGKSWEETGVISHVIDRIEAEGSVDGCTTRDDVYERYRQVDDLYRSIRQNGFVPEQELNPENHEDTRFYDHVAVHVGRDGELIFATSGCHRLAIAQIVDDVDEIPVWIRARHPGWQETRDAVAERGSVEDPSRSHPDLRDVAR